MPGGSGGWAGPIPIEIKKTSDHLLEFGRRIERQWVFESRR